MNAQTEQKKKAAPVVFPVRIIVLGMVAAGAFMRVWGLSDYAFSPDEVMHANVAAADSLPSLWGGIKTLTNGPLMYAVLRLLIMLGKNEMLLRCISLVPGACLIIVFYVLGKKTSGTVSGITMALLAAFGCGAIQVSQVVRPYSMLLVFLAGAFYFFVACMEKSEKKYFCGYGLCMLLAMATYYCTAILCAAIGCAWLAGSVLRKKPAAEYRRIILVHLPLLALFCIIYFCHISFHTGGGGAYTSVKETYLAPLFPRNVSWFIRNTRDFFRYASFPCGITLLMVLSFSGIITLWLTSRRELAAAAVFSFTAAIVLAGLKLFPFGGTRHSIYLLPLVCLPAGAAVQYGFDVLKKLFPAAAVNQRAPYVYGILAAMVIFLTGALAYTLKGYTYSPQYNGGMEFPVPRADYDRIMRYLMHSAQQPGALLTDLQTYHYFAFSNQEEESGKKTQLTHIALGFLTFDWQDFGGYLIFVWEFNNREIINAALQALKKHAVLTRFPTIYLVNIGWESGFIETVRTADPLYKTVFKKQLLLPGGYVYALSAQEVQRQIDAGRFQNPPVEAEQQGALKK